MSVVFLCRPPEECVRVVVQCVCVCGGVKYVSVKTTSKKCVCVSVYCVAYAHVDNQGGMRLCSVCLCIHVGG